MKSNFETIGYKNSSAHELLSKKYATFFTFHGRKWRQIFESIKTLDVIFGHVKKMEYFFERCSCALEFL